MSYKSPASQRGEQITNNKLQIGFTLVELLVVILVIFSIGAIITAILFSAFRGANKTNTIDIVRRNGDYAISQMARMMRYARSFDGASVDNNTWTTDCSPPVVQLLPSPSIPSQSPGLISYLFKFIAGFISKPQFQANANTTPFSQGSIFQNIDNGFTAATWSNPSGVSSSDNVYSTVYPDYLLDSDFLRVTGFNFSIPAGSTINGISVEIESHASVDEAVKAKSQLVKGGSTIGSIKNGAYWTTSDSYETFGGSTNLWGATLTPADINDSSFGVQISVQNYNYRSAQGYVDVILISVYYTPPPTPIPTPTTALTPTPTPIPGATSTPTPTLPPTQYHYAKITSFDGGTTTFSCLDSAASPPNGQIASNGASLVDTVNSVKVAPNSCYFTCLRDTIASPPTIGVNFSLSAQTTGNFFERQASIPFKTSVTFRNY